MSRATQSRATQPRPTQVDPRGLRVGATITSIVLALVLVTPQPVALVLLATQTAIFAVGALGHPQRSPYGIFFARVVRPRIGAPDATEDAGPPRFAQAVGLGFAVIALIGFALGASAVGYAATAFALVAALLNASVGLCLGCEMYLALRRLQPVQA